MKPLGMMAAAAMAVVMLAAAGACAADVTLRLAESLHIAKAECQMARRRIRPMT